MPIKKDIRRVECSRCSGAGKYVIPKMVECKFCDGNGWHGAPHQEVICKQCEGVGRREEYNPESCLNCAGRGHFVKIFQIKKVRKNCRNCPDVNDPNNYESIECSFCNGSGYDPKEQTCGHCNGDKIYRGWPCSYCAGMGSVNVSDAKKSAVINYVKSKPCYNCVGNGLLTKPIICVSCGGIGYIIETKELDITPKPSKI